MRSDPTGINYNVEYCEEMIISSGEIQKAISRLDKNKSCGVDNIYAEHLKYASTTILPILSLCLTGFLFHGALPDSMLSVVLVP